MTQTPGNPHAPRLVGTDLIGGRVDEPNLKLAGDRADSTPQPIGTPIVSPADPRWVMALRTAECLEGEVLPPEKRDSLLRLGKVVGLSPFDVNLVIAIVQHQARRGIHNDALARASESQLAMIALPEAASPKRDRAIKTAFVVAMILAVEILIFSILL